MKRTTWASTVIGENPGPLTQKARDPGPPPSMEENPVPSPFVERKPWASTTSGKKNLKPYHQ